MLRIGLFIQDLSTDYSNKIVKGTKQYCIENGIELFVFIVRSKNWKNGSFDYQHFAAKSLATKGNIDGILLVTNTYCQNLPETEHTKLIEDLSSVPVVSFGAEVLNHSSVNGNAEKSFRNLLNHMADEHNCKNIYLMGPESTSKDIIQRFNVFNDFIKSKDMSIENRIIYANYTYDRAKTALKEKGITKDNLPFDAIVCCNDSMAFGCIDYFKEHGINVPEDVKVTGFDNQLRCDFTTPTLTTIDQCIENQCYAASELLHREILNPEYNKQNIYIDARIVFRQSCGCNNFNSHAESFDDKYYKLRNQLQTYHYFMQDLQAQIDKEKIIGYFKSFGIDSCICCIYDNPKIMKKNEDFVLPEKAEIYFAYNQDKIFKYDDSYSLNPKNNMYPQDFSFAKGKEIIVTALFIREYQYGYIIYTPGELDYNTYDLIVTTTGISLATNLVFTKKNAEQQRLFSDKKSLETESYFDELTGVLNRRGFFHYAVPALNDAVERKLTGGVIFGDMDYLKSINDTYGHEAGDDAIKNTVKILKKVFRTEDLIGRLGGDEFLIYSCGLTINGFTKLKLRLSDELESFNQKKSVPYKLSISLGYVEFNSENKNLDQLMKKADENQYMEKKQHHRNRE